MRQFVERHSLWSFVILIALGVFLWLVFAIWPEWLEDAIGRKKTFVNTFLNGLTLAGLYFLVASGFTRSEEHTSELQSLMRISYAVFCLTKNTTHTKHSYITTTNNNTTS